MQKANTDSKKTKDASLADSEIGKSTKSRRERLFMRYSPLVERYLITHNYETINNVSKWTMLLTQRTEINKIVDAKFKKFRQIADQSNTQMKQWNKEYEDFCKEIDAKHLENKKAASDHQKMLQQSGKDKRENGQYSEQANMLSSINVQKTSVGETND